MSQLPAGVSQRLGSGICVETQGEGHGHGAQGHVGAGTTLGRESGQPPTHQTLMIHETQGPSLIPVSF